jgi:hypothetical protein
MYIGKDRELSLTEMLNDFTYQYQEIQNQVNNSNAKYKEMFPAGFKFWIETYEGQDVRFMDTNCFNNKNSEINMIIPYEHIKQRSRVRLSARYRRTTGSMVFSTILTTFPETSLFSIMQYVVGCRVQDGNDSRDATSLFRQLMNHERITLDIPKDIQKNLTRTQNRINRWRLGLQGLYEL